MNLKKKLVMKKMNNDGVIMTKEALEELEAQLEYMVNGQGFDVVLIDTKHTRRRTLGNTLRKQGVENIIEAENYAKAVAVLTGREDKKNILISDLDIGKVNGLKLITDFLKNSPRSRGIVLTDNIPVKLLQIVKRSKMLGVLKRPFAGDAVAALIKEFGFPL